ncbi:carbohydrate ABC transporter permease [Paenibacillus endoradicis]|uniref:carbohydrate ABC transporter permease n=1 Tax=Paenibacillus endoradicis TaxID=2972487 RepID=UPI002159AF8B|nr:sugar ABC transporter permease [Paenibacillus endoradicis]MCR8655928.1 sugar ABC transporter permease [Paenibacillus endoradicis]MCR8658254.1 sugar ABC transporter permease [Paenibacillus endoradicis]
MKQRSYLQQKALWGIIFAFPWLIGFIFFFLVPLVDSLRYSFSSVVASSEGLNINFIGLENYINALTVNTNFNRSLVESIVNMVVNVPLIVIFSLFIAVLLNQKFVGRAFARSIFFLPVILASGIILTLESSSLIQAVNDENIGSGFTSAMGVFELENMMLRAGVSEIIVQYLTGAVDRIYQIVSQSGVQILIFLAAIQTIPPQLYEASTMEGATGYESFWKITFPMVSPLIFVNMIYTIIDSFSVNAMTDLIRQTGFTSFNFGLSSAMAWIYFLAIALILLTSSYLVSKRVFYYD